jgi:hypothetical protein
LSRKNIRKRCASHLKFVSDSSTMKKQLVVANNWPKNGNYNMWHYWNKLELRPKKEVFWLNCDLMIQEWILAVKITIVFLVSFWCRWWFVDEQLVTATTQNSEGFVKRIVTTIVNNLQIYIDKIHIRYEDDLTNTSVSQFFCCFFKKKREDNAWQTFEFNNSQWFCFCCC